MGTILKADIFFFIASCAVILIAILFAILLMYAIGILRQVRKLIDEVKRIQRIFSMIRRGRKGNDNDR